MKVDVEDLGMAAHLTKNVLVLGTAGAGKSTLVNHILGTKGNEPGSDSWISKDTRIVYRGGQVNGVNCNFISVDTAGPQQRHRSYDLYTYVINSLSTYAKEGLSLIILLVRQGCCTPPDLEKLTKIIEQFFTDNCKPITVLIHSGCDGFDEEAQKDYIQTFATGSEITRKLNEYPVSKKVLCIGFPNIEQNINPILIECYKKSIQESEENLRKLILESQNPIPTEILFKRAREDQSFFQRIESFCVLL